MDLIVVGHSHIQALRQAALQADSVVKNNSKISSKFLYIDAASKWTSPLTYMENGRERLNPSLGLQLEQAGLFNSNKDRVLVSALAGNIHNALGLISDVPFELVVPGHEDLPIISDVDIVPIEQVFSYLRKRYEPFFRFIKLLQLEARPLRTIWIESPAPIPSEEHIRNNLDAWFKNKFSGKDLLITPPSVRHKLWLAMRLILQDAAVTDNWSLQSVPEDTVKDGYLVEKAWAKDATHGSLWYGEQVLRSLYRNLGN